MCGGEHRGDDGGRRAPPEPRRAREILPLTGIRFPITFAVLLLHFAGGTSVTPAGGFRIPLFFVLSGFVMAAAYYPRPGQGLSTAAFYARRIARLYPLLVLTSLPVAFWFYRDLVLPAWNGGHAGPAFWRGVLTGAGTTLFPPAYLLSLVCPVPNGYAWFVMVELSAGLFFPACARLLWKLGRGQLVLVAACLPLATCAFQAFVAPRIPPLTIPFVARSELSGTPLAWLPILVFGAATYGLYVAVDAAAATRRAIGRLATPLSALAVWLIYFDLPYAKPPFGPVLVYCQLGLTLIALSVSDGWAARLLSTRPLLYMGRRSYSIYMTSIPAAVVLMLDAGTTGWFAHRGVLGSVAWIALTSCLGLLTYRFVESPCRRWLGPRLDHLVQRWESGTSRPSTHGLVRGANG